jgi:DNA polymerase elongation subunit (family B)
LFGKKKYCGGYWTKPEQRDKVEIKGLEAVRRDSCVYVSATANAIVKKFMDLDAEGARAYALERAETLLKGEVPMEQLILSKKLNHDLTAVNNRPPSHVVLAKRMQARGDVIRQGDRMEYYFFVNEGAKKGCDQIETKEFMAAHDLKLNYVRYFKHQLEKPLSRLLTPLFPFFGEELAIKASAYKAKKRKNGSGAGKESVPKRKRKNPATPKATEGDLGLFEPSWWCEVYNSLPRPSLGKGAGHEAT